MRLEDTFKGLFSFLHSVDYAWEPQTPDQLLKLRKNPENHSSLIRYFGLGTDVHRDEVLLEGLPDSIFHQIDVLRPAVSRSGSFLIPHHHWSGQTGSSDDYVYFGQESLRLIKQVQDKLELFEGKKVLDLGSGSGVLSFEVASLAKRVLGIELSRQAVEWANATARAYKLDNTSFVQAKLGTPQAEACAAGDQWDIAVFNPPMVIPRKNTTTPYRDGGKLGVELPLIFMDYSRRHLKRGGDVFCLVTNPIVSGRSVFFDHLNSKHWKTVEKRCLNDHFNHSLYRKDDYASQGIQRVELWFLHLKKL